MDQFSRTELLLGTEAIQRLKRARVAVFGVGGVGGYVCEALARSGVGTFYLIDRDTVSLTNLNRQIIALHSTVGRMKTEVMRDRILDINPEATVHIFHKFFLPDNAHEFPFADFDYVVDAVDTVSAKLELVTRCQSMGIPIICSMGAGNKLDPTGFRVADLSKTSGDPLARVMRKELKQRGIKHVKVVYSQELPVTPQGETEEPDQGRRSIPGSIAFVPAAAGLVLASAVIQDLSGVSTLQ